MAQFKMEDLAPAARESRLDAGPTEALAMALLQALGQSSLKGSARESILREFLLPLAESGLGASQMLSLLRKVPEGWHLSHREIYYDFRLARWQKHIEPPTIAESLDEYLENAPSREEGLAYLRRQWREFLERNKAG